MVYVSGDRERLCHPLLTQCLNICLVSDSLANTAYIYVGSLRRQTCCSVIDGKLQFKDAPAAKKLTKNEIPSTAKKMTK